MATIYRIYDCTQLDGQTYDDLDAAIEAVAAYYGWDDPWTSDYRSMSHGDGIVDGLAVYDTEQAREDDQDGAYAPWILVIEAE